MLEFGWTVLPFYWLIATCSNALATRRTHRRNCILKEKIIASLTLEKRDSQNLRLPNSKIVMGMIEISYVELVFRLLCMFQGF